MNKKIGIIVYARTSSKRFPNKILHKISGIKLIDLVINRLKKIKFKKKDYEIVVNTSLSKNDNKIVLHCKKKKIKIFRGSLRNVYLRTYNCIQFNKYEIIARVNCDRPFVDIELITKMIKLMFKNKKIDIITNCIGRYPKGLGCELAKSKIFIDNLHNIRKKSHKEHIFNYFYENKKKFNILNYKDPLYEKNSNFNFSIDKRDDVKKISKIFNFFNGNYYIKTKKILENMKKIKI